MYLWHTIRHALFVEHISKRAACRRFGLSFRTIQKIAAHPQPGSYRRRPRSETTISPFLSFIEGYLTEDKSQSRKQRHTCKRIYERLRDEQGYTGSYRTVCLTLAALREKAKTLYIPLAHPPGHAQYDFGFADAVIGGVRQQVSYASISLAERRPNGLAFGAPFAAWELPSVYDVLRRRLETQAGKRGKREYIRILRLLERCSLEQLTTGIERSLATNTTAYEGVRLYMECAATVPVELFSLDGRPLLQQVSLPEQTLNLYSTLLERSDDEKTRNETDGTFETSFTAVETAGLRAGRRGDGVSMCEGEHRPSGIPVAVSRTGTVGSGGTCGGAAIESSTVPQSEDTGKLRLQMSTVAEQNVGQPVDAGRVHRAEGIDYLDRAAGDGQDASGDGTGDRRVSDGKESPVLSGERSDYATLGGERRTATDTIEKEFSLAGSLDTGRTGLCPGK